MISVYDMTTGDWRSQAEPAQAPQPAREHATDLDLRLMTIDGAIALDVLSHFAERAIPCLGVHDSFVVPRHSEAELREMMLRVYREKFAYFPVVS